MSSNCLLSSLPLGLNLSVCLCLSLSPHEALLAKLFSYLKQDPDYPESSAVMYMHSQLLKDFNCVYKFLSQRNMLISVRLKSQEIYLSHVDNQRKNNLPHYKDWYTYKKKVMYSLTLETIAFYFKSLLLWEKFKDKNSTHLQSFLTKESRCFCKHRGVVLVSVIFLWKQQ